MKFRAINERDIQKVAGLHFSCFSEDPYPRIDLEYALSNIMSKLSKCLIEDSLVAEENGIIVAYALASLNLEGKTVVIGPVGVDENFRGKKLGLEIVSMVIGRLGEKGFSNFALRINSSAPWLEGYYSRIGFKKFKEAPGYIYMGFKNR